MDQGSSGAPAAGWYPSPDPEHAGRFARYWDGSAWTEHLVELSATGEPAAPSTPATPSAPAAPAAPSAPAAPAARHDGAALEAEATAPRPGRGGDGTPARRLTWLPKLIIGGVVALMAVLLAVDRLPADGPIGYSLTDATTEANRLVEGPRVRVSSGPSSETLLSRPRTGRLLTVFTGTRWDRDVPLTIELIPAYDGEPSHRRTIDLRQGGANVLTQDWYVRIDIVARDRSFDVTVSQPALRGLRLTHAVVYEDRIARGQESVLRAQRAVAQQREADRLAAERQARADRAACQREEGPAITATLGPLLDLRRLFEEAETRRRIFSGESVTHARYRADIANLVSDARGHARAADRALEASDARLRDLPELPGLIAAQVRLTDAWDAFRVALLSERSGPPDQTFGDLYPREWSAVIDAYGGLNVALIDAEAAVARSSRAISEAICEERYPLP